MHGKSTQCFLENFIEKDHAGDLDVDARSILKIYCRE
jgi:hypothetical protein